MLELKELHHHHISILGYNHISEWTLQQLLLYYAKTYLPTYDPCDPDTKIISKVFNYLKDENIKLLQSMKIFNYDGFVRAVYTDDSKNDVKDEINVTSLDIDVLVNVLKQIKCFPVKGHTKKFKCSKSRVCNNCPGNGNCLVFGNIKRAIDALLKVRHLAAHQAKDIWIQLQDGTFNNSDFPCDTNFHQLWDIYTDHLKTIIFFLKDNGQITGTQAGDREYQLVNYGSLKDSNVADSRILVQYANYVIAQENQLINKSIDISFDLEISDVHLPSRILALNGELMDHVVVFAEFFIASLSGVKEVDIRRRGFSEVKPRTDPDSVRVEITLNHRSPLLIQDYTNMGSEQSETFVKTLFAAIKDYLDGKYHAAVDIFLKEWKPGSIKLVFNIEHLEFVDVQFKELEEFMKKQLASLIPNCLVDIFIQHKGNIAEMERKLFLSFTVMLVTESIEDLPTADIERNVEDILKNQASLYLDFLTSVKLVNTGKCKYLSLITFLIAFCFSRL